MLTRGEFKTKLRSVLGGHASDIDIDEATILYCEERDKSDAQFELNEAEHAKLSFQLDEAKSRIAELEEALRACVAQVEGDHAVLEEQDFDDEAEAELSELLAGWKYLLAQAGGK